MYIVLLFDCLYFGINSNNRIDYHIVLSIVRISIDIKRHSSSARLVSRTTVKFFLQEGVSVWDSVYAWKLTKIMLMKISLLQQFHLENNFFLFEFIISSHCLVMLSTSFISSVGNASLIEMQLPKHIVQYGNTLRKILFKPRRSNPLQF